MNWREHKKLLINNPEFIKEYDALETEYKLAATLIRLRLSKGLTQEELAKALNTKQESIARLESGGSLPSLSTIKKIANALGADLEINLRPKNQPIKNSLATKTAKRTAMESMKKFAITLEEDEDGFIVASCPALPGCHSQGRTEEQAIANIGESIQGYFASVRRHGELVPAIKEVREVEVFVQNR
jgi:predicted RNase H-like HicB family nuclease/DNA-binding XRE family transcriptional regulator